jgi:hypothetical protein
VASQKASSKTRIKVLSREVALTYLQSVQVSEGSQDPGKLAGEGGGVGTISSSKSNPGSPGFLGIGASSPSSQSSQSTDTGWSISRTWRETHFDKVRYSIGRKDVGVFHYRFAEVSEFVTVAFKSPKPIYKVELRVVEQIPSSYPIDKRYIDYYVSADNGKTWHQINPLDMPTITSDDGSIVPRTITFNPEIGAVANDLVKYIQTEQPVMALRLRGVIRQSQDVPDPDQSSPFVKKYKLLMYPRGGLTS